MGDENKISRYHLLFISISFIALNFFYSHFRGISPVDDTIRFIKSANLLLDGQLIQPHDFWYISYCSFLALLIKLNIYTPTLAVSIQVFVSLFATYALYFASKNFFDNTWAGFIAVLLNIIFLKVYSWNFFVLTESFYCSFICFLLLVISLYHRSKQIKWLFLAILIAIITFFLRPNGIILIASFVLYLYLELIHNRIARLTKTVVFASCIVIGWFVLNQMLETFQLVENYMAGEVVFHISKIPTYKGHEQILFAVPKDIYLPSEQHSTLVRALIFMFKNPLFSGKLMILKVSMYYSLYRPYFSLGHNIHNIGILLFSYLALIIGLKKRVLPLSIKWFTVSFILLSGVLAMFTNVDWDGRFLMGLLPFVFCFGGGAIANQIITKLNHR